MNMKSITDCYTLANGVAIPCVGLGTWKLLEEECINSVQSALELGYRHIDTATAYRNEKSVGEGIHRSGIPRNEIFVTDKLWNSSKGYEQALAACKKSLDFLGLEYLDLYLIHWPRSQKHFDDFIELNNATWRAFETLYKDGYVRAIGVSNFLEHHLDPLLDSCSILPTVNQMELSPGCRQDGIAEYCQSRNILCEAYSPLARGNVLHSPQLAQISSKHKATPAQICLNWSISRGYLPLPKSAHTERLHENTNIFSFKLDDDDNKLLDELSSLGRTVAHPDNPPF